MLLVHFALNLPAQKLTDASTAPYETAGVPADVLSLERKTHMGLPRALAVARQGWPALRDDPALVRVWIEKANSR